MAMMAGYCALCRKQEIELFGRVLAEPDRRHEIACVRAGCKHPPFYNTADNEDDSTEEKDDDDA